MSLENLKSQQNLTLDEIILLINSEKDINVYKKLNKFKEVKETQFSNICDIMVT